MAIEQSEVAFPIKMQLQQNSVLLRNLAWTLGQLGNKSSAGGLIHGQNTTLVDLETMIKGRNMMLDLSIGQQWG